MYANTSTPERRQNPIAQWEDDGGPPPDAGEQASGPRCTNVGMVERALSVYVGGSLLAWGLSRRSFPGLFVAAFGGALVHRGTTGRCRLYDALHISTADGDAAISGAVSNCSAALQSAVSPTACGNRSAVIDRRQEDSIGSPGECRLPAREGSNISSPIAAVVEQEHESFHAS